MSDSVQCPKCKQDVASDKLTDQNILHCPKCGDVDLGAQGGDSDDSDD